MYCILRSICEQLADGIGVVASDAAAARATITTIIVGGVAITPIDTVTTFVPLCFMLTILSFILYSFYRYATWAVEMESFHSFIHEHVKAKSSFLLFHSCFFLLLLPFAVLVPQFATSVICAACSFVTKGYNEKTNRSSMPLSPPSKIKRKSEETETERMHECADTNTGTSTLNTR